MARPLTPFGWFGAKLAALTALLALAWFALRPWSAVPRLTLSSEPRSAIEGQDLTIRVNGPPGARGSVQAQKPGDARPTEVSTYVLDTKGTASVRIVGASIGSTEYRAVAEGGSPVSHVVPVTVHRGLLVPGSSIVVVSPWPGSSVERSLVVRGKADPSTEVKVAAKVPGEVAVETDAAGEWWAKLDLARGATSVVVTGPGGEAVTIPVKVL